MVSVHSLDMTGTRKEFCGRIPLYIRVDIPSRLLNSKSKTDIETVSVQITLRKRKWNCSYNRNKNLISNHLECLNGIMVVFSKDYNNVIFLGDFDTSINDNAMRHFCSLNDVTSLIDQPTCYKILTNRHVLI